MHQSTLIQFCSRLTRKEMTRYRDSALSPYFNKHKDVLALVTYLNAIYPDFSEEKCEETLLYQVIFGKKAFDKAKLKHVFSYALKLMEQFLAVEQLRDDEAVNGLLLLKQLRYKSLGKRFESRLDFQQKMLDKRPFRNSEYWLALYSLKSEADLYSEKQAPYKRDLYMQAKVDHLDLFYLSEQLKNACEMINRQLFLNVAYQYDLVEQVITYLKAHLARYQAYPSIIIYYQVYLTLTESEERTNYDRLTELLEEHADLFPIDERRELYYFAYNYCLRQVNQGQVDFLQESFNLMKILLEKDLLIEQNYLYDWHYKNIIAIALRLKSFEWTESFIHEYKSKLPPNVAENAFNFGLASYYYSTQQYDQALGLLHNVEYTNIVYNLDAKSLLLRIYYELEEEDSMDSLISAFRQYLRRNNLLSKNKFERYSNLFKLAHRSFKIKMQLPFQSFSKNEKDIKRLRAAFRKTPNIANKNWLINKVEMIEKLLKK